MQKGSSISVMPINQNFLQWAWNNEPWLLFVLGIMFLGMYASIYFIVRKINN
ncbi:MAG: hypothetical protein KDA74_21690 [Planctomycetaceae bacterium]|nr:hypothetical protein [Planctomycetaceae bacterium]